MSKSFIIRLKKTVVYFLLIVFLMPTFFQPKIILAAENEEENKKKMIEDTTNALMRAAGFNVKTDAIKKEANDFYSILIKNNEASEFLNFAHDYIVRRLFHGKEDLQTLVQKKVIKNHEYFNNAFIKFTNYLTKSLNEKYYFLNENEDIFENSDYIFPMYEYTGKRELICKFRIIDMESYIFTLNDFDSGEHIYDTKFGHKFKIHVQGDNSNYMTWKDEERQKKNGKIDYMAFYATLINNENQFYNINTKQYYNSRDLKGFDFGDFRGVTDPNDYIMPLNRPVFISSQSGFTTDKVVLHLIKIEKKFKNIEKPLYWYFLDITNDFEKLKSNLVKFGYREKEYYSVNNNIYYTDNFKLNINENITKVKPVNINKIMLPYKKNYYKDFNLSNLDTNDLKNNIDKLLNEHLKSYNYELDKLNELNKSQYDYLKFTIDENNKILYKNLQLINDNNFKYYQDLNNKLNDLIDNNVKDDILELNKKIDSTDKKILENKELINENTVLTRSLKSDITDMKAEVLALNAYDKQEFKVLNDKIDGLDKKMASLSGFGSSSVPDDFASRIKDINDKIDKINELNPQDRITQGFNFFDKFIKFFTDFFVVTEKFEIKKLDTTNLSKKIPFSLLGDLKNIFQSLVEPPKVPVFVFPLFTERIILDFNNFKELAAIIRSFTLVSFVVAVMLKLFNKMG